MSRGQALVELALCAPVVALLALGAVAIEQVADARAGLQAATQAATAEAARAPDAKEALSMAQARFAAVVAAYPVSQAELRFDLGGFDRAGVIRATASGSVEPGWASLLPLPLQVRLTASAAANVELWRTHR